MEKGTTRAERCDADIAVDGGLNDVLEVLRIERPPFTAGNTSSIHECGVVAEEVTG